MYHHISSGKDPKSKLVINPFHFEKQMKHLKTQHYQVVDLETLFSWILDEKPIPLKTVAITFDDGYDNSYTHAFPILKKYGFPATIFLITNSIGSPEYLTPEQIQEMEKHGIRFGNHSFTHPILTEIPLTQAKKEIIESKKKLAVLIKHPSSIFCYPEGRYNLAIADLVKQHGYRAAVSASPDGEYPLDKRYGFKRIRISHSSNNLSVFQFEISGYYSFIGQMRKKIKILKSKVRAQLWRAAKE